jgi:transposase
MTLTLNQCGDTLSMDEVCAVVGVSRRTWERWRRFNREPIAEMEPRTARPRWSKSNVQRYLDAQRGSLLQRRMAS